MKNAFKAIVAVCFVLFLITKVSDMIGERIEGEKCDGHLFWETAEVLKEPTCTERGIGTMKCMRCGAISDEKGVIYPLGHEADEYVTLEEPTETEYGLKEGVCTRCGETFTSLIDKIGTNRDNPLPKIEASTLKWSITSKGIKSYAGKYVIVTGTIQKINRYDKLTGYYLQGSEGNGLVCWVDEDVQSHNEWETVTFLGRIAYDCDESQVEIQNCEEYKGQ